MAHLVRGSGAVPCDEWLSVFPGLREVCYTRFGSGWVGRLVGLRGVSDSPG